MLNYHRLTRVHPRTQILKPYERSVHRHEVWLYPPPAAAPDPTVVLIAIGSRRKRRVVKKYRRIKRRFNTAVYPKISQPTPIWVTQRRVEKDRPRKIHKFPAYLFPTAPPVAPEPPPETLIRRGFLTTFRRRTKPYRLKNLSALRPQIWVFPTTLPPEPPFPEHLLVSRSQRRAVSRRMRPPIVKDMVRLRFNPTLFPVAAQVITVTLEQDVYIQDQLSQNVAV